MFFLMLDFMFKIFRLVFSFIGHEQQLLKNMTKIFVYYAFKMLLSFATIEFKRVIID
jgi:hypothetical protein